MLRHQSRSAFFVTVIIYSLLFAGAVWSFNDDQAANSVSGELSSTISMELLSERMPTEEPTVPENSSEQVTASEIKKEIVADLATKPVPQKQNIEKQNREKQQDKHRHQERRKFHKRKYMEQERFHQRNSKDDSQMQSVAQGAPLVTPQQNMQGMGTSNDEIAKYRAALRQEIERHKHYSQRARMLRRQGVVVVEFSLMTNGELKNVRLHRSSGYDELDQLALAAVSEAKSVGARPIGLSEQQEIPIKFILR